MAGIIRRCQPTCQDICGTVPLVMFAGVALMVASVILFGVGFAWSADSRARARVNVATILGAYIGMVLTLTARLV